MKMDAGPRSGSGVMTKQSIVVGTMVVLIVLAGCSGMSSEAEEEMMELMNHTATGEAGSNMSMNDSTGGIDTTTESELLTFDNQTSEGKTVTVRSITLSEGGYAVVHTPNFVDGRTRSVLGVSEYLQPGHHRNVTVPLFSAPGQTFGESARLTGEPTLLVVPHRETNENQKFDFITIGATQDTPYRVDNGTVPIDSAVVTVQQPSG